MDDILSTINQLFAAVQSAGSSLENLFVSDGIDLLAALGLIVATWHTLLWLLDGDFPNYFSMMLRHVVKVAVLLLILTTWSGTVHSYFVSNMQTMADRVAGGSADSNTLANTLVGAIQTVMSGTRTQSHTVCTDVPDYTLDGGIPTGTSHQDCHDVNDNALDNTSFWTAFKTLPVVLLTLLAKAIALIAMVLCVLIFVVVVQMGSILLHIAFCLGPILVPWFVFPPTEFLFENWLRAVIGAGLYKVIAWIMMGLVMKGVVPGFNALLQKVAATNGVGSEIYYNTAYLSLIALALVASIGAFLMWQVPQIASTYAGGGGASLKGFGKGAISKMAQGNGAS
ncbi:type IV secretion system protein [Ralstonia thomasii]|uniref:Conjugal transfer protein TrbL n=1 Tax=Ralstonia thomasii TaxID=3058596 RepID=A0ABM9JWP6_9RALS|nr:type IV secretion system protein [Ralstonia sp. LMG 18095]CAJ0806906.1 hypothetical protein LMG18095_04521 [Ralstonia sp. LMG 18095]